MRIRFYNANILTMRTADKPEIIRGELYTTDDKIIYVGDGVGVESCLGHFDREIDCKGNLLMPGFKNAHTHSPMTFLRSHADDLPLQEWLNNQIFPYEAKLTPEDIYACAKVAVLEYLTSGITACMEMYMEPAQIARAFAGMGMRLVQVGAVNDFSQSVAYLEEMYQTLNGAAFDPKGLTSYRFGFHAQYTNSDDKLDAYAALAHKYKAPFYTHLSETKAEVESCKAQYGGKSPVEVLVEKGIFDFGGAGYHMVHLSEHDMELVKEKKIGVVTNPGSNTKLASGIAPISEYLRREIPVAIGTDGPASNNCLDMFREMFLVTGLAKLREQDASAVPAYEVLKMATTNGAAIMGLPDTDCLDPGKKADIIMIDLHQPNMQPVNHMANNLVYSGSKQNVMMTMVNGEILYDCFDGKMNFHVGEDVDAIYAACDAVRDRIFA